MDLGMIMQARGAWKTFTANHPKFPDFLNAVNRRGIPEDTIIEIELRYPDGEKMKTNLRVKPSDLELLEIAKSLR